MEAAKIEHLVDPIQQSSFGLGFDLIESELKQIENKWKEKYQPEPKSVDNLKQESKLKVEVEEKSTDTTREDALRLKSELLRRKFLSSIEIHKKPTDLNILTQIFAFRAANETDVSQAGKVEFQIDNLSLNQLLFIEYILERIAEILTARTKAYLLEIEKEAKTVSQEREEEEFVKACDAYVAEKAAVFGDINFQSDGNGMPGFIPGLKAGSENLDEEAEMQAKLKGFENLIQESLSGIGKGRKEEDALKETRPSDVEVEKRFDEFSEGKKPMPNFEQLKATANEQQLKIKEFFEAGSRKDKKMDEDVKGVTIIDEDGTDENSGFNQNMIFRIKETDEQIVRIFPVVDSHSQIPIRRNIFYDKLIRQ